MATRVNPLSDAQFGRLDRGIEWSNRQLVFAKDKRVEAAKEFAGYHYMENGASRRVPVSFLKLAVSIYVRLLAARAPRALITTKESGLKPTAADIELAVNEIPREIELQRTLKRVVTESLFSFGVVKSGLSATSAEVLGHSYGSSFVDIITLDNFIIDMTAMLLDQIQYIGNDYWLDYEDVMESKWFPKKSLKGLESDDYTMQGEAGEEKAGGISLGGSPELFKKKVLMRDVFLPTEQLMVTYQVKSKRRMKVTEWTGPERGPYSILGYNYVPGNLLPLPPVAAWRDLHELGNTLFRKLGDQADAQKTVQGFHGDEENVERFKNARDGDGIAYSGAEPKTLKAGGVDPTTLLFYMQVKDLSSYFAGNIDSLGGLSAMSETLGQDRLLSEASSAQLRDMASEVIDFTKGIFKSLVYYEWHDPIRQRKLEKIIPGTDLSVIVPWDRESRRGQLDMYDLEIDVYSLQDDSPGLKLQKLVMIMQTFILPLMPAITAQGGTLDAQAVLKIVAKLADFEELEDLVQFMQGLMNPPTKEEATKPANTTRTNVRVNRPGATDQGKSGIMQQLLAGGRPQGAEMAAIGRPSG